VRRLGIGLLVVLSLGFSGFVFAQSPNATISGIVFDPSGRVIVAAEITAVNDATRVQYFTKTNNDGIYVVGNLPPGNYRLQVAKVGFKTLIKPDIILNVQDALAINFTLPIGAASETVTVIGGVPLVSTESAGVSTVVDRQFAENLPMNGRSFQTLIELTPGVVLTASNSVGDSGQFSVNGQRATSNYWMVDGVSANFGVSAGSNPGNGLGGALGSFSALGGTNSLVSVDAMQEFRILTSTYAPEFGRTPGGQISIVTRSGTDQFHGTLFDYLRNDLFDANDWFADHNRLHKPKERQNDFGGTFGGPIVKDRTFLFFSYEGLRLRLPQVALTAVPDLNARQSAIPALQPFLNAFPFDPKQPDLGNGIAQFDASFSNQASLDAYSIRIDHRLSDKLALFGRYNYSPSEFIDRGGSSGGGALSVMEPARIGIQTTTVGATWTISPTVTNDFRFNYSRANSKSNFSLDNFGGAVPLAMPPFPAGFDTQNAQFSLSIFSLQRGAALFLGEQGKNLQRQINLVDSLSMQRGAHSLKFGVDFRRLSPLSASLSYLQSVSFRSVLTAETGAALRGFVSSDADVTLLFRNLGFFAQDTWRVKPRLTLTYGLRWDVDFAPSSLNGPSIPAVTGYNLSDFSKLAVAPAGTSPFKTGYANLAPRVGVAYELSQARQWQTVLRGGFGVFYDLVSSETGNLVGNGFPPFAAFSFIGHTAFPFNAAQIAPPPIPQTGTISELYAFNPNLKLPYTLEWNVAVDQALGKQQAISASYVGASGRRLLQSMEIVGPPANPALLGILVDNTASSNYNALQIQFQRRLSGGLQALASYTWAHSIDTGSAGSTAIVSNLGVPGSNRNENRGPSDFDIRNAFSAGVTYDIPSPKRNRLARAMLGGWSSNSIVQVRSAPPLDVSDANFSGFGNGIFADIRPDLVPGQPLFLHASLFPGGKAINPAAFTDPPVDPKTGNPLRQGNAPRNALRGFGAAQWDFAVHRDFRIHEQLHMQFRAEIFNLLNHPNFGPPNSSFTTPLQSSFGVSTQMLGQYLNGGGFGSNLGGGGFSPLYQIGGPRSIQFALKFQF
jgi:hypothetical protein